MAFTLENIFGWTIKNSAIAGGINYDYAKEIVNKYNSLGEKGWKISKTSSNSNEEARNLS
jgi:hypothetical protein